MEKIDFGPVEIRVPLPNQIQYVDPANKSYVPIDEVIIKRLKAPEITLLRTRISQESAATYTVQGGAAMVPFVANLNKIAVRAFFCDGKQVHIPEPLREKVIAQMPMESAMSTTNFVMMHMKEASFLTTAYRCRKCNKSHYFDIDPMQELPDTPEKGRGLMQDYLDYTTIIQNKEKKRTFKVDMPKGYSLAMPVDPKKKEGIEWEEMEVAEMLVSYPTLETYHDLSSNPDRSGSMDFYAIFEHIEEIGGMDKAMTQKIKAKNGIDKILNLPIPDMNKIILKTTEFRMDTEHFFQCDYCQHMNEVPFDTTNFFEFLKSSVSGRNSSSLKM